MITADAKGLRVAIAGGGIGGLAAAVALRLQGHEIEVKKSREPPSPLDPPHLLRLCFLPPSAQVFEKAKLHTETGAAVYSAPNCTAALSHLGIDPRELGGVVNTGVRS